MFLDVIDDLRKAKLPDLESLKCRFRVAVIKKEGVIKLPYHFWSADQKINPLTKHLLWVAVLLEDREAFSHIAGIVAWESAEYLKAKSPAAQKSHTSPQTIVDDFVNEFLCLPSDKDFQKFLKKKLACTKNY